MSEYNATTGAAINANFITGLNTPQGLAVNDNSLFVAEFFGARVGKYDATTGVAINANFITGLGGPGGLALLGNTLFVADFVNGTVGEYDATTGSAINFVAGLTLPYGIAVKIAQ